jgi:uncharacterized protein YggU (UPF0235/DUF167 family)
MRATEVQGRVLLTSSFTRRAVLAALGGACVSFAARGAHATVMRGLSLTALVQRSDRIVIGVAVDAQASFVTLGGTRRIVTDVRVRVDEIVAKGPANAELRVRVLGGRVGREAELVEGQAEMGLGAPCLLFLRAVSPELHWVNGMAQGHFPLEIGSSGATRLAASPRLPELLQRTDCAVDRLVGQELEAARALVRGALAP